MPTLFFVCLTLIVTVFFGCITDNLTSFMLLWITILATVAPIAQLNMPIVLLYATFAIAILAGLFTGYPGPWMAIWIVYAAAVLLRQAVTEQRHRPTK